MRPCLPKRLGVGGAGRSAAALRLNAKARIQAMDQQDPHEFGVLDPAPIRSPLIAKRWDVPNLRNSVLTDSFQRKHDYLRISLTERCNLRCFYCMPEEGIELSPNGALLTDDEIIRLARLFVQHGVTKIRLTGGEPTIRRGIIDLVGQLGELRSSGLRSIGMTSNGLALHRKLSQLVGNGLSHLNLSLDTLDPVKFELITRRRGHEAVIRTMESALALEGQGLRRVKLNVVVVKGINDDEILDFVELARRNPISIRFIEFMPFSGNRWNKDKLVPSSDLLDLIKTVHPNIAKAQDELNDTARNHSIPGFQGNIGFISSMSDHFCHTCNRLRITSDGTIKVCLFDGAEISLRDAMRDGADDEELARIVSYAVGNKQEKHEHMENIDTAANRPMILIGGRRTKSFHGLDSIKFRPIPRGQWVSARLFSSTSRTQPANLTHVDEEGRPAMVDVSDKTITTRSATASGQIRLSLESLNLIYPVSSPDPRPSTPSESKALSKGPVLHTATLAGILAAKQTSSIIPLCHPIPLNSVKVSFVRVEDGISCEATVTCDGKTGVEMEALTAVSGALLCVWDMVKAVDGKTMVIGDIKVVNKSGGRSGAWERAT